MKLNINQRIECPVCHAGYRLYLFDACPNCTTPETRGATSEDLDAIMKVADALQKPLTRKQAHAMWLEHGGGNWLTVAPGEVATVVATYVIPEEPEPEEEEEES